MHRECRERFPSHHQVAIPACITACASSTCRDKCRDRYLAVSFEVGGGENVPGIPSTCATRNFTYLVHLLSLYEEYVYHFMKLLTMFVTSLLNVFMVCSSKRKLPTTSGNNILVQAKLRQPYMANRHRYVFCLDSKLRCYHPFILTDQAPSPVNIFIALYTCSASCHLLSFS